MKFFNKNKNRLLSLVLLFSTFLTFCFSGSFVSYAVDFSDYGPLLFTWSGRQEYGASGCVYTLENFAMWSYMNPNNGYNMFGYYWNGTYNGNNLLSYYPDTGYTVEAPLNSSRNQRYGYWYADYSAMGLFESSTFYVFSSESECLQYLAGDLDATEAINYDEINPSFDWLSHYDSEVPTVSYLSVPSINPNSAKIEFGFDDYDAVHEYFMENGLSYQLDVYPIYCTKVGYSFLSKWSATKYARTWDTMMDHALGFKWSTWAQNHLVDPDDINNNLVDITTLRPVPEGGVPSLLTALDGFMCKDRPITFNEDNCDGTSKFSKILSFDSIGDYEFVGVYCQVRTYSGNKTSGWTYVQKFNNDNLVYLLDTKNNYSDKVDDLGDTFISSDNNAALVSPSSVFDNVNLDNPDLTNYVRTGYGLLGSDGYIQLSQQFLLGIPNYIWVLIAFALSVNIIVIVFKALRGM